MVVKFGDLQNGESFIYDGVSYVKQSVRYNPIWADSNGYDRWHNAIHKSSKIPVWFPARTKVEVENFQ